MKKDKAKEIWATMLTMSITTGDHKNHAEDHKDDIGSQWPIDPDDRTL